MSPNDRQAAFDLILQIRAELLLRDEIKRNDLKPEKRCQIETTCNRLTLVPSIAIESALDRLTTLNALIALI